MPFTRIAQSNGAMVGDYISTSFSGGRAVAVFTLAQSKLRGRLRQATYAASVAVPYFLFDAIWNATDVFRDHLGDLGWGALALGVCFHVLRLVCVSRAWRNIIQASFPVHA